VEADAAHDDTRVTTMPDLFKPSREQAGNGHPSRPHHAGART
jgi:hypothetical protein